MRRMNRRDALFTTGSMIVSASLGAIACGAPKAVAQNTTPAPKGAPPPAVAAHEVFEAAHDCIKKGDACIAHCLPMLAGGDTSMGDCARAANDMRAVMVGLAAAAASGNPRLADLARAAMLFCEDCHAACQKHAANHVICRECAEACARTIAACKKLVA